MTTGQDPLAQTPLDLYAEYLLRRSRGEKVALEDVCRARPELAERVRELAREEGDREEDAVSVTPIHAGRAIDSGSAEEPAAGAVGMTPEILQRLAGRGSAAARYELRGEVARGGQGAVVRVWDRDLRRTLAMKVTLSGEQELRSSDTQTLGRFLEEAQVTAQLDHPGIVPVHELGLEADGRLFFTMRLVKGRDLKEIIQLYHEGEAGWNLPRVLGVMLKVCEAMAYAHDKDVIHRDLKPKNVMVGRHGQVYVMDWGLARILGHADLHDLRLREPEQTLTRIESERSGKSGDALLTMDGTVIGTPAYMSPEQAEGRTGAVDRRSDVYSAGAILYHVLIGHPPYIPHGVLVNARQVLWRVIEGPPPALHKLAPSTPEELVAICEKAMERDPAKRYPDMAALAEDLRAFLEHRVVRAYETGALAEFKKWVVRNKPLAATVLGATLVLVLGSTGTALVLAGKNEDLAKATVEAETNATAADAERANVMRLSGVQKLDGLIGEADSLWPAHPENVDAYRSWQKRALELVGSLRPHPSGEHPGHLAQLAELRARALPETDAEHEAGRRSHPRFAELEAKELRLEAWKRAQAVRDGGSAPAFVLDAATLASDPVVLNDRAVLLVETDRTIFGREAEGLALARAAVERSGAEVDPRILDTLAFALLANGLDDDALRASTDAVERAGGLLMREEDAQRAQELEAILVDNEKRAERLKAEVADARGEGGARALAALEAEVAALEQEIGERRTWHFADSEDQWWHDQLAGLVAGIEALADERTGLAGSGIAPPHGWSIQRRLAFAQRVEEESRSGPEAARRWREAIASIADQSQCPAYGGLVIAPQLGLLPIGRDPHSKLWEFALLQSGTPPLRDPGGKLVIDEGSAVVLVLLPGGTFTMGAQSLDSNAPRFDPRAKNEEEPPRAVTLSPFFLSKYEMTQAQWERIDGENPSANQRTPVAPSLLHPVENVSWNDCHRLVQRLGLALPTEAQWEYAARAGTDTIWWTGNGRESLIGAVNLADLSAAAEQYASQEDWIEDGYRGHAPVDRFRANPFGLHSTLGNVIEWCLDGFQGHYYKIGPSQDPSCPFENNALRVLRGGSFDENAIELRCSRRASNPADGKTNVTGLRPARALDR